MTRAEKEVTSDASRAMVRGVGFFTAHVNLKEKRPELKIVLVPDTFDCFDAVLSQLFTKLPDVYIDGAVAHHHIVTPYALEDLVACKHLPGLGSKQREQLKLL